MLGCALLGYFFIKVGVEPAPLLLGLVLGPQLEENFRRAMLLADGDFSVFLRRPISATLLALVAVLFLLMVFPAIRRSRQEALAERARPSSCRLRWKRPEATANHPCAAGDQLQPGRRMEGAHQQIHRDHSAQR